MNLCGSELSGILQAVTDRYGWRCRLLPDDDRVVVHTGRARADSEPISLLVRLGPESTLLISDGGETVNRLAEAGLDRNDPVLEAVWQEALATYRVQEVDDRVFLQAPLEHAAHALNRLADSLVALDALRLVALPASGRPRTLAVEVEEYLERLYSPDRVKRGRPLKLKGGLSVKPALTVNTYHRGEVLVQPGAASSVTQSYDHAYATFALARRGGVPMPNCLVVLGGRVTSWNLMKLRALADVAFVGFWAERERVHRFLDGEVPDDPLMAPEGVDVPLLP